MESKRSIPSTFCFSHSVLLINISSRTGTATISNMDLGYYVNLVIKSNGGGPMNVCCVGKIWGYVEDDSATIQCSVQKGI